jgi:SAM-dependent methyltransferase
MSKTVSDAYTLLDEPLQESAPLATRLADSYCNHADNPDSVSCDWYHGAWQYLRLIGIISGVSGEVGFFRDTLREHALAGKYQRILVAGAADYAILAHIIAAYRAEDVVPEITVLDRCRTPLYLSRWYAERYGLDLDMKPIDIFEFEPEKPFDLICTHSFFSFVPTNRRHALAMRWRGILRDGGRLVTSQVVRPGYSGKNPRIFSCNEVIEFRRKVEKQAALHKDRSGISVSEAGDLAQRFAEHKASFVVRSKEEIRDTLEKAGFTIDLMQNAQPMTQHGYKAASPDSSHSLLRIQIIATAD